jgi:hypothetical protein
MRRVLAVEGVVTEDGRILMPGSVTWRDETIPVIRLRDRKIIGAVTDIRREDNRITGEVHLDVGDDPEYFGVGADMDDVQVSINRDLETIRFTGARLRGVTLVKNPSWPECRLEEAES